VVRYAVGSWSSGLLCRSRSELDKVRRSPTKSGNVTNQWEAVRESEERRRERKSGGKSGGFVRTRANFVNLGKLDNV
jgi:hypothetical protein